MNSKKTFFLKLFPSESKIFSEAGLRFATGLISILIFAFLNIFKNIYPDSGFISAIFLVAGIISISARKSFAASVTVCLMYLTALLLSLSSPDYLLLSIMLLALFTLHLTGLLTRSVI